MAPTRCCQIDVGNVHSTLLSNSFIILPEWCLGGRQIDVWRRYRYIAQGVFDKRATGCHAREGSRTVGYPFNDCAACHVALLHNDTRSKQRLRNKYESGAEAVRKGETRRVPLILARLVRCQRAPSTSVSQLSGTCFDQWAVDWLAPAIYSKKGRVKGKGIAILFPR